MSYKNEIVMYKLQELFFKRYSEMITSIHEIKPGASDRKILRLSSENNTCIGIYNENVKENIAFVEFSKIFFENGLKVPVIFEFSDDKKAYLEEDLGDVSLYSFGLEETKQPTLTTYYKRVLADLLKFQIEVKDKVNYEFCCETEFFDSAQVDFDLNKFNTYYLTQFNVPISPDLKIKTFNTIKDKIQNVPGDYFMFRDFQPRNIMIKDGELYYIDYQSGRKGPLQYDLASFIFSSSIELNNEQKQYFLDYYIKQLSKIEKIDEKKFVEDFYYVTLIRLLQMLGNYGWMFKEKNEEKILLKIPRALENLEYINNYLEEEYLKEFNNILRSHIVNLHLN